VTSLRVNGVPLYVYLNALFATVIQTVMGYPFYISAYKSLRHKSANMDVLIMLGTTAAWLYGIVRLGIGYSDAIIYDQSSTDTSGMDGMEASTHSYGLNPMFMMAI
jgi:cation transport ATPase